MALQKTTTKTPAQGVFERAIICVVFIGKKSISQFFSTYFRGENIKTQ
jgi:hypothetical protein